VVAGNGAPRHRKLVKQAAAVSQPGRVAGAVQTQIAQVNNQVRRCRSHIANDGGSVVLRLRGSRGQMGIRDQDHARRGPGEPAGGPG